LWTHFGFKTQYSGYVSSYLWAPDNHLCFTTSICCVVLDEEAVFIVLALVGVVCKLVVSKAEPDEISVVINDVHSIQVYTHANHLKQYDNNSKSAKQSNLYKMISSSNQGFCNRRLMEEVMTFVSMMDTITKVVCAGGGKSGDPTRWSSQIHALCLVVQEARAPSHRRKMLSRIRLMIVQAVASFAD
jgi:hypothetical protein